MHLLRSNKFMIITLGIITICCILTLFWPKNGSLVLIGKLAETLLFLFAGLLCAIAFFSNLNNWKRNIVIAVLAAGLIFFSTVNFVSMASDLASGPKTQTLENCHVEQRIGIHGFSFTHLVGKDETGNGVRIRISMNAGHTLQNRDHVTVYYYEKSSRLIKFY